VRERGFWASVGAVAVAAVGSSCCWLPLLLLALGAGTAATSVTGFVESFRLPVVAVAVVLLGLAAYFTYLHKTPGEC